MRWRRQKTTLDGTRFRRDMANGGFSCGVISMSSPSIQVTYTTVGPAIFRQWRSELGLTEEQMASEAKLTVAQYLDAEQDDENCPSDLHWKVLAAFQRLGKEPKPIETNRT